MAIFDKYDLTTIAKAVDLLYERAAISDEIRHYFNNVDMNKLREHQIELLSHVMGGPATFRLERLKIAHQNLSIPSGHFDLIKDILRQSLNDVGIEIRDVKQIMEVVESVRNSIVKMQ